MPNTFDRAMSITAVMSRLSVLANFNQGIKDDFDAWRGVHRARLTLTDFPADFHVYLGGARVMHDLNSCGGLWVLAHTAKAVRVDMDVLAAPILETLFDKQFLARSLLLLRSGVEGCDRLLRMSECRLVGAVLTICMIQHLQ